MTDIELVHCVIIWQDRHPEGSVESIWTTREAAEKHSVEILERPMMADDCHACVVDYVVNTAWGATVARATT